MAHAATFQSPINDRGFGFAIVEEGPYSRQRVFVHVSTLCRHPVRKGRPQSWQPKQGDEVMLEIDSGSQGLRAKSARCHACHRDAERTDAVRADWKQKSDMNAASARVEAAQLGVPLDGPCQHCGFDVRPHWEDPTYQDPQKYVANYAALHSCGLRRVVARILRITDHTTRTWVDLPSGVPASLYRLVEGAHPPQFPSSTMRNRLLHPQGSYDRDHAVENRRELLDQARKAIEESMTALGLPDLVAQVEVMVEDSTHQAWHQFAAAYGAFTSAKKVEKVATDGRRAAADQAREAKIASAQPASSTSQARQWLDAYQAAIEADDYDAVETTPEDLDSKSATTGEMVDDTYSFHVFADGSVVVVDNGCMGDVWTPEEAYASLSDAQAAHPSHDEEEY